MGRRSRKNQIPARTPGELDAMQAAGEIVGRTLQAVRAAAKPGVTTKELDAIPEDSISESGYDP
ncbi:MAG: type I methionyl aminopeptidase, partial [Corynebacterium casei]|nr:type I methionyl aminopeptidase [Corynebacterium casei]